VRPPKKSWKNISNLSGGEKTLSSLALVFALHHYKVTPRLDARFTREEFMFCS
jgi:structural maintenance of chromosome 4